MNFTYDDIDAYLNGELDPEQQQAFEEQLKTDEQLKKQFEEFRFLQTTIDKHQQAEQTLPELKKILVPLTQTHFHKAEQQKGGRVISMNRIVTGLALAASIVLILLVALPGVTPDNYTIDNMPGAIVRGAEDDKAKAAQLFNNEQYAEAAKAFAQLRTTAPADASVDFYLGISLLKTKQYAEALSLFESLANGTSVYAEDANFFTALSAYHLQQNEKAKRYAEKVTEGSRYWKNTKAVLKKVK